MADPRHSAHVEPGLSRGPLPVHLDEEAEPKVVLGAARSGRFIQLGLVKVMHDIQRAPYLVELTAGLDIALNVPGSIESWIAGEPVFERASAARQ